MKKITWFFALCGFCVGAETLAANLTCTLAPITSFDRAVGTINNFNYQQTINNATTVSVLSNCSNQAAVRSDFRVATGNTNLTATGSGGFPFGVDSNIILSNSTANAATQNLAKTWLSENLKIAFDLNDDVTKPSVAITALNQNFNVHPNTSQPGRVTINGEEYLRAGTGLRNAGFRVLNTGIALINSTTPSSDIIAALNDATIRIHLGTVTYKYDNYSTIPPSGNPNIAITELYLNLKLSFSRPTCSMSNQTINLASVSASVLNSQQSANEQNFNISIDCTTSMPSRVLVATIKDSYTPSNVNTNGILKNRPSLVNRSNVDIQLTSDTDTPVAIGTQTSFYSVPTGSTATTFIKALKARYFRSAPTATPGFVQTQATVSLDYQ